MSIWTGLEHIRMVVVNAVRQTGSTDLSTTDYFNKLPLQAVTFVNENGIPINFGSSGSGSTVSSLSDYDVVLVIGQSNSCPSGSPKDSLLDIEDPRILQYPNGGTYNDRLVLAKEPIFQGTGVVESGNENNIGFASHFAKNYVRVYPTRKLVIIPMGIGNTGFSNNRWNRGNDLYNNAVTQTNEFLANYSGSKLVAILFHMGERDHDSGVSVTTQKASLLAMLDGLRLDITNGANIPFITGGHSSDWVPDSLTKALYNDMYSKLNRSRNYVGYASSAGLNGSGLGNEIHFSAASMRVLGDRYFAAWQIAKDYVISVPPIAFNLISTVISSSALKIEWEIPNTGVWETFKIQYRVNGATNWLESPALISTSSLLTGLLPTTNYDIRIRSINNQGSSYSALINATTNANIVTYANPKVWLTFATANPTQNDYEYGWLAGTNITGANIYVDAVRDRVCRFPSDGFMILYRAIGVQYTRCAWIKLESYRSFAAIFGSEDGDAAGRNGLLVNGISGLQLWNNYSYLGTTTPALPIDTWIHACITYSSVGATHTLYINGLKNAQLTGNTHAPNGTNDKLFIGAVTFGNGYWNNPIDDVMLFDYAMTEAQVAKLYQDTVK
jgi:hypothetical protein